MPEGMDENHFEIYSQKSTAKGVEIRHYFAAGVKIGSLQTHQESSVIIQRFN
jgi:hypothetical protein